MLLRIYVVKMLFFYQTILLFLAISTAQSEPKAKLIIHAMDEAISNHVAWDDWTKWSNLMEQFFTEDMVYDTNYFDGTNQYMGNGTGIRSWWDREHIPINEAFDNETFNQIIFASEEDTATTTTYAIAPWTKGPFLGVQAPNKVVRYRIFDFYKLRGDKICYNWMILDSVHLLYEAGFDVLPRNHNPLDQGWVRPPKAMDGIPAPLSRTVNPRDSIIAKQLALQALNDDLLKSGVPSNLWTKDMTWYGSHGFGVAENIDEYSKYFLEPISTAFANRSINLDLMVCEGHYCGAHGYLIGKYTNSFLGEKASNTFIKLRFGLHWHVDTKGGKIVEGYGIFDLPAFFIQSGVDLFKRAQEESITHQHEFRGKVVKYYAPCRMGIFGQILCPM